MQLDFHPVEKVHFNTFAQAFAPKMMEIGLPRLRMNAALSNIYPELFPASPGAQLQEISVSIFSIPHWVKYDYNRPLTLISCHWAPGEAGNSSGQILLKAPDFILTR